MDGLVIFFGVLFAITFAAAIIFGIRAGISATSQEPGNQKANKNQANAGRNKGRFNHPTKINNNPIPSKPRYYNVGAKFYHKSKECYRFKMLESWDAVTEENAIDMGLVMCPECRTEIVFVYPRGNVYHRTKFCSDAQSIPAQMPLVDAISKGLCPCKKCH